ncbi:BQ2448_7506 [Microbotryum intermedium]|uniref:BQ2448_7506 protein n=1 Tax=Microbotryum intermedium TaxID=269621 RepID=A0A238FIG6_9BASI|nr:BQ2448_7506 [Microbotryum intermedium]
MQAVWLFGNIISMEPPQSAIPNRHVSTSSRLCIITSCTDDALSSVPESLDS